MITGAPFDIPGKITNFAPRKSTVLKKHIYIYLLFTALILPAAAPANDFDRIVGSLLRNDRDLKLSYTEAEAQSDELATENVLADPEVEFEFLAAKGGEKKYSLSLSQSFDWPGAYSARSRQYNLRRQQLALEQDIRYNEKKLELQQQLIDIIAANRTIATLSSAIDDCNKLLQMLTVENQNGNVTILDLNKTRIEIADFKLQLSQAISDKQTLIDRIAATTEISPGLLAEIDSIDCFPLMQLQPLEQYMAQARDKAPQLLAARNITATAQSDEEVARKSTLPSFSAGYRLSHEDGLLFNGFAVGVSLPLWRAEKQRRAAASQTVAARLNENMQQIKLEKEIEAAYNRASILYQTITEYGQATDTYDNAALLNKAYAGGVITVTQLILDTNYFLQAEIQLIELQRQYYNKLTQLSRFQQNTL